jgi:AmiR/NasT family two-component response regulator
MYSTTSDAIDPDVQHLAELFATHASLALGRATREENLYTALGTRKVIGQALGIVMERYDLTEDRAFEYLARVSQHRNVKLRDTAAEMANQRNHQSTRVT